MHQVPRGELSLPAGRRALHAAHRAAQAELGPLRSACRRDPRLRPLAAQLERAAERVALLGALGEHFARLAIEQERDVDWLRRAREGLASGGGAPPAARRPLRIA